MNFKRIELVGFKSFADKQEIQFENGVTCIVGPNGCGKSNVADAIRWVLGEQSAKQLRGSNMQDVIFNGTQNRKPLSYCEVSLVFDNTDHVFKDLEYSEVVFTRKLYRSGESEYYVNRKLARLKDIVDYLREGGVSKEGYTIIGQGKVAEILSSKPEDRRTIFEEAVGIAKTKQKRLETSRKLDRTRDNIVRISDITSELENQLEPLRKQAEKARSYQALSEELKYHEVNAYLYKSSHASQAKATINDRIRGIVNELALRSAELDDAIKSYNRHQKEIADADDYVKQVNDELLEKTQEFERQSGNAKVYGEKINYFRNEIKRLRQEILDAENRLQELAGEITSKKDGVLENEKQLAELEIKGGKVSTELARVTAAISEGEQNQRNAQDAILKSVESLADLKQNIGALSSEKNVIEARQKETNDKLDALSGKLSELTMKTRLSKPNSLRRKNLSPAPKTISRIKKTISRLRIFIFRISIRVFSNSIPK